MDTAEGRIEYAVPQVSDAAEPFCSQIRAAIGGRTEELERLAVEMYARSLSVRDIEAAFVDANRRSLLSKSAVSEITERRWADYQAFASRDLASTVLYLFVDGIAERLHLGQPRKRCWAQRDAAEDRVSAIGTRSRGCRQPAAKSSLPSPSRRSIRRGS